jgi:CheY-like chemotaxis protein
MKKDGTRLWASGVVAPIKDGDGKPWACVKILCDSPAAEPAAGGLGPSEELLRAAVLAAEMGFVLRLIPVDALPAVFDMISRLDRAVERSTDSLGVGLNLLNGLAELRGTPVAADRVPGRRSTAVRPGAPSGDGQAGPTRRVLVVDDDQDSADSMAILLRLMGHEVRTARDGLEAVDAAEQFRPDLVLMDVSMPKLDGYAATRRIREQAWGNAVTIVALTGWGQAGDKRKAHEAGCDGHLLKPVNLPDLQKLLDNNTTSCNLGHNTRSS